MKWEKYQTDYTSYARSRNLQENILKANLDYAYNLFTKKLPIIYDAVHLSKLVGYNTSYLKRAITHTPYFYRHYLIPKKNGGTREISEPLPSLKEIQNWILKEILEKCSVSRFAKAYVKKKNLRSNAIFHRNKPLILLVDINNFFGSIEKKKIKKIFSDLGYTEELSDVLSGLCTLNNSLPQGAPTSPYLSNMVSKYLDQSISEFCLLNKIAYTRYSDDLVFSGEFNVGKILAFVKQIFKINGFSINEKKLRTKKQNQSQRVTGIVVNKKLQAPKETRKDFRKNVYYIRKFGLDNHLKKIESTRDNYLSHLIGKGEFICSINKYDKNSKTDLIFLKKLKCSDLE